MVLNSKNMKIKKQETKSEVITYKNRYLIFENEVHEYDLIVVLNAIKKIDSNLIGKFELINAENLIEL